jgi:hypothetical protein
MTQDTGGLRKPVQSTWQEPPIVFPTKAIDEYRLGCLRSVFWCVVAEVGIGLAGFIGWRLWFSVR